VGCVWAPVDGGIEGWTRRDGALRQTLSARSPSWADGPERFRLPAGPARQAADPAAERYVGLGPSQRGAAVGPVSLRWIIPSVSRTGTTLLPRPLRAVGPAASRASGGCFLVGYFGRRPKIVAVIRGVLNLPRCKSPPCSDARHASLQLGLFAPPLVPRLAVSSSPVSSIPCPLYRSPTRCGENPRPVLKSPVAPPIRKSEQARK